MNSLINNMPFEAHLPKYQYCGSGTKLAKRLARGDSGINELDRACKEHDISYSKYREKGEERKKADKILDEKAWEGVNAADSSFGEKAAAMLVTGAMKLKSKMGMGVKRRAKTKKGRGLKRKRKSGKCNKKSRRKKFSKKEGKEVKFTSIVSAAKNKMGKGRSSHAVIKSVLSGARAAVKKVGGKRKVLHPRIFPLSSKIGGALPFSIPLFAGVTALAGGAAGIAKAINDTKAAREQLEEYKRHNNAMKDIALGHLKPYKTVLGLYLKPYPVSDGDALRKRKKSSI